MNIRILLDELILGVHLFEHDDVLRVLIGQPITESYVAFNEQFPQFGPNTICCHCESDGQWRIDDTAKFLCDRCRWIPQYVLPKDRRWIELTECRPIVRSTWKVVRKDNFGRESVSDEVTYDGLAKAEAVELTGQLNRNGPVNSNWYYVAIPSQAKINKFEP